MVYFAFQMYLPPKDAIMVFGERLVKTDVKFTAMITMGVIKQQEAVSIVSLAIGVVSVTTFVQKTARRAIIMPGVAETLDYVRAV